MCPVLALVVEGRQELRADRVFKDLGLKVHLKLGFLPHHSCLCLHTSDES